MLIVLVAGVCAAALLGVPAPGVPANPAVAAADEGDDAGERRIDRTKGRGLRACRVARRRAGGGVCRRVIEDRDDRERYEVTIRRGVWRYEIDLSRRYRVLEVDRERVGGGDDDDVDDATVYGA